MGHKRTGPVHILGATLIFGPFCPNHESTARIPTNAENCAGGGGGGGDSSDKGVHEIPQVPRQN